ncbi:hypothetical protein VTN49DRAFT_1668 [Thermomyces lanuginosus]|uniref:uncharacterized protein n=1 Tax=Thermomyces lanuginosus TaxID=5541 RepID=UPI00374330B5
MCSDNRQPLIVHSSSLSTNRSTQTPPSQQEEEDMTGEEAQARFDPEACLFVGNLSVQQPPSVLVRDLQELFRRFGLCYAHVKYRPRKKLRKGHCSDSLATLPSAWVQFTVVEDADRALESHQQQPFELHGRQLRVEKARGQRAAQIASTSAYYQGSFMPAPYFYY